MSINNHIVLQAKNILVEFGQRTVLNFEQLILRGGDRIGLIGENGAGKTMLLQVLAGDRQPDSGSVQVFGKVAQITQLGDIPEDLLFDRTASEFKIKKTMDTAVQSLSGGELTRRKIASALQSDAQILLADEPTTNLDIEGIEQLTKALANYAGALMMISHDRALLDSICTCIIELEEGALREFPGNYSAFAAQKERERDFTRFEYEQYRAEKKRLTQMSAETKQRGNSISKTPKRMGNSEARLHKREAEQARSKVQKSGKSQQTRLEQLEVKQRPRDLPDIKLALEPQGLIPGKMAVWCDDLTLEFPQRTLLRHAAIHIPANRRTVLIGENGCGKSTLVRAILNRSHGSQISPSARIGYFSQDFSALDERKTALENAVLNSIHPQHMVRTVLARLNLPGEDVNKRVSVMSGGERAKVQLAGLIVSDANFLILDEPTNHLDLYSLEALREVLAGYQGTLLMISHDRYTIDCVAQHIIAFNQEGLTAFAGSYTELRTCIHR